MLTKISILTGIIIASAIFHYLVVYFIKKNEKFDDEHLPVIKKSLNLILGIIILGAAGIIFSINIENVWSTVLSVLAIIAVALFTIWSLLSNIVAGILLFATRPFKLKDWIEIHPENIQGKVKDIGVMFVTLEDIDKNLIRIPNNLIFQKYTKVLKKKPSPPEKETAQQETAK